MRGKVIRLHTVKSNVRDKQSVDELCLLFTSRAILKTFPRITCTGITPDDINWLCSLFCHCLSRTDTHLLFVSHLTQKRERRRHINRVQPVSFLSPIQRGEKELFIFIYLWGCRFFFFSFSELHIFFFTRRFPKGKTTQCCSNTTYNQQLTSRASTSAACRPRRARQRQKTDGWKKIELVQNGGFSLFLYFFIFKKISNRGTCKSYFVLFL